MSENCNNCFECLKDKVIEHPGGFKQPVTSSRMILCPVCGNKRCPKATNHMFFCTGSNEPGQDGSRFKHGYLKNGNWSSAVDWQEIPIGWSSDMSEKWVPRSGQLIRWLEDSSGRAGQWAVIVEHEDRALTRHDCGLVVADWNCEPLLPVNSGLTLDQAWDALRGLPDCEVFSNYQMSVKCMVATPACTQPTIMIHKTPHGIQAGVSLAYATPAHDASNDACRQMLGALRTWIEGVPVGG